jgi:Zn-finger nucleic acid-binding protein
MKCPVDGATLAMMNRSGVEIDYCPQCREVWLDRAELDEIIDRAEGRRGDDDRDDDYRYDRRGHPGYPHPHPHRKKESFRGRVFDFD